MKAKILLLFILVLTISCDSENHYHDGVYENSILGINRKIVLNGNIARMTSSITGTTESKVKQFEDRVEYVEENGNTAIYYFLDNGDLKVSDYIIFHKVKSNNQDKSLK